jgi:hypothetical protein
MDKRDWYFNQIILEDELDAAFDDVEKMQQEQLVELGLYGVTHNPHSSSDTLNIEENAPTDMSVKCSKGVGYTKEGKRAKRADTNSLVDCSKDVNGDPTVPLAGLERYISIFILHEHVGSELRSDGNQQPVYFMQTESHKFEVINGATATPGNAIEPLLRDDALLLADVLLDDSVTVISGYGTAIGQINTSRKETWEKVSDSYRAKFLIANQALYVNSAVTSGAGAGLYSQAFPRAWAHVKDDGTVYEKYNIFNVTKTATGTYEIDLYGGLFSSVTDHFAIGQVHKDGSGMRAIHVEMNTATKFTVYINDGVSALRDEDFSVVVFGRPT